MKIRSTKVFSLLWAVLTIVPALTGCDSGEAPTAPISGTVTLAGEPLTDATVLFYDKVSGAGATCLLDASGGFSSESVPLGDYQVTIGPPPTEHAPGATGMPPMPELPKKLPKKYTIGSQSGLTAKVEAEAEANQFTFELQTR